jgi:hypothetical protein
VQHKLVDIEDPIIWIGFQADAYAREKRRVLCKKVRWWYPRKHARHHYKVLCKKSKVVVSGNKHKKVPKLAVDEGSNLVPKPPVAQIRLAARGVSPQHASKK